MIELPPEQPWLHECGFSATRCSLSTNVNRHLCPRPFALQRAAPPWASASGMPFFRNSLVA
jgi:hypothetical protein